MATTQFAMAFAPSAFMPDQAQALAKRARRKPSKLQENFAATPEVEKRKTKTQRNKKRKSASTRQPRSISHLGCYVPEQPPPRGMTPAAPTPAAPPRENFGNVTERQLRQLMDQTWSAAAIHGTDRVKAMLDALTHTTSPSPGSVPIGPQHGAAGSSNSSAGNTQPPARQQTAHGQHGQPQEGQNYSPAGSAKVIWIMGHSYIYWAHIRTKRKTSSEQMGIPHSKASLFWLGKRGMRHKCTRFKVDFDASSQLCCRMASSSRAQVLSLYKAMLRESKKFSSYNYRLLLVNYLLLRNLLLNIKKAEW
ncbi:LYR motif-containing protein 4 isoform X2 [Rhinatrema bivittatum]|uniref:LYR motif-containing protein 4 isoform X2 n=1 Tax=Rhinatrema bivittatum TaxID=194408 RepID=UPI001125B46E|nr:LYR motif-containing protein 4 isoform X2 [Rhinatrema bivittatum]